MAEYKKPWFSNQRDLFVAIEGGIELQIIYAAKGQYIPRHFCYCQCTLKDWEGGHIYNQLVCSAFIFALVNLLGPDFFT
jgi:hypothetical protein